MSKQFERVGKSNGGVFQYKRIVDGKAVLPKMWAVDYRDARGKRARKMGLEARADAVAFLNENSTAAGGAVLSPEKVTFSIAVREYKVDRDRNGKKTTSYYYLDRFDEHLGEKPIRKISSAQVRHALERIVLDHKLGLSTRNRHLAVASGLFTFAKRRRWVKEHPIRDGAVERYAEPGARERWFRPHEIQALIEKAPEIGKAYMVPIITFAAVTGKRLSEVTGARRADQRQDASGLPVLYIGRTKNGTPESYPLTGAALEIVERQAARCTSPSSHLFPGPGGASAGRAINRYFKVVVAAVAADHPDWGLSYGRGRDQVTFHTLRHSFATIGHAAGMTEKMLMQTGNWRSRSMLDKYVHSDDAAVRSMIEKVGDLVVGRFPAKKESKAKRA